MLTCNLIFGMLVKKQKKVKSKTAKHRDCAILIGWIKSIVNHFWWCCASCKGDEIKLREEWLSLLCHIVNKHNWGKATKYTKCAHSDLTERNHRKFAWLNEGTPAYLALELVVRDKTLLSDLKYLAKFNHSGQLRSLPCVM